MSKQATLDFLLKEYSDRIKQEKERRAKGVEIHPTAGFVLKAYIDTDKNNPSNNGRKIFVNVCSDPHIDEPHEAANPQTGEKGLRVPLSCGDLREDVDNAGKPCLVVDAVFSPVVLTECRRNMEYRDFICTFVLQNLQMKHDHSFKDELRYPRALYKGGQRTKPLPQTIRIDKIHNSEQRKKVEKKKKQEKSKQERELEDFLKKAGLQPEVPMESAVGKPVLSTLMKHTDDQKTEASEEPKKPLIEVVDQPSVQPEAVAVDNETVAKNDESKAISFPALAPKALLEHSVWVAPAATMCVAQRSSDGDEITLWPWWSNPFLRSSAGNEWFVYLCMWLPGISKASQLDVAASNYDIVVKSERLDTVVSGVDVAPRSVTEGYLGCVNAMNNTASPLPVQCRSLISRGTSAHTPSSIPCVVPNVGKVIVQSSGQKGSVAYAQYVNTFPYVTDSSRTYAKFMKRRKQKTANKKNRWTQGTFKCGLCIESSRKGKRAGVCSGHCTAIDMLSVVINTECKATKEPNQLKDESVFIMTIPITGVAQSVGNASIPRDALSVHNYLGTSSNPCEHCIENRYYSQKTPLTCSFMTGLELRATKKEAERVKALAEEKVTTPTKGDEPVVFPKLMNRILTSPLM